MRFYPPEPDETERDAFYDEAEHDAIDDWLHTLDYIMERDKCSMGQARKTFDKEFRVAYHSL